MPSEVFSANVPVTYSPEHFGGSSSFAMQIAGIGGTPTAWNVVLEISIDGTMWAESIRHTEEDGENALLYTQQNPVPVSYMRIRVVSMTLGPATGLLIAWSGA